MWVALPHAGPRPEVTSKYKYTLWHLSAEANSQGNTTRTCHTWCQNLVCGGFFQLPHVSKRKEKMPFSFTPRQSGSSLLSGKYPTTQQLQLRMHRTDLERRQECSGCLSRETSEGLRLCGCSVCLCHHPNRSHIYIAVIYTLTQLGALFKGSPMVGWSQKLQNLGFSIPSIGGLCFSAVHALFQPRCQEEL